MEEDPPPNSKSTTDLEKLQMEHEINFKNNCEQLSQPYKPGWNDPPLQSYSDLQTTPHKPRNILKKRVPFPLAGQSTTSLPESVNIPPPPAFGAVDTATTSQNIIENVNTQDTICIDSESVLEEVMNILTTILDNSSELGTKINDIKKRINKMEDMWANRKLEVQVQVQMKKLAKALQEGDTTKADDIHKALMVDYVSEVCTWMPGIKQLIYHCAARAELMAIDKD